MKEALQEKNDKTEFGFWLYLMTDCILFASLFAVYAVLKNSTFGGPSGAQIFNPLFVLGETMILLTSSFMCGIAIIMLQSGKIRQMIIWLCGTGLLGLFFLAMELTEFSHLLHDGNSFQRSGFLSAFFTLVGTHGLHITVGLLWLFLMLISIVRHGVSEATGRKLVLWSLFWHFLDVIWILIFTIVYMMGIL